ncbi:MAG: cyclic-phosphate processing receiver domain-containing protein [Lysobacterales bacterium]
MRVYLDDERTTPDGWVRVYWPAEAIELLERGCVTEISLDHDLGDDDRGTGYDVVLWIEEAVATRDFQPPLIHVHSANTSAREKMLAGVRTIERLARKPR